MKANEVEETPGKCCGNCISYLTDEDENGKVTDFHHDRNKDSGFCALCDLFYGVEKTKNLVKIGSMTMAKTVNLLKVLRKQAKQWLIDNGYNPNIN